MRMAGFQMVQEKLVRMLANIQAMYLMSWRLSELVALGGRVTHGQAALVKVPCRVQMLFFVPS